MVGSAIAVLGVVIRVLQVHDQDIFGRIGPIDRLRLKESQVIDAFRFYLPLDVQLFLLVDFVLFQLSLCGFGEAVGDIRPDYVLLEGDDHLARVVCVVLGGGGGSDRPHGPVVVFQQCEIEHHLAI